MMTATSTKEILRTEIVDTYPCVDLLLTVLPRGSFDSFDSIDFGLFKVVFIS